MFLINRFVERKSRKRDCSVRARLHAESEIARDCIASAMPNSVMPSGAKNGKVSKEKKRKNLAVLTKTPRLKRFVSAKLLSSNVETVWR